MSTHTGDWLRNMSAFNLTTNLFGTHPYFTPEFSLLFPTLCRRLPSPSPITYRWMPPSSPPTMAPGMSWQVMPTRSGSTSTTPQDWNQPPQTSPLPSHPSGTAPPSTPTARTRRRAYPCNHSEKHRGNNAFVRRDHLRQHLGEKGYHKMNKARVDEYLRTHYGN